MRQDELLEMIQNGESSKIEFKTEEVHPIALAEEVVTFANFEGGAIGTFKAVPKKKYASV